MKAALESQAILLHRAKVYAIYLAVGIGALAIAGLIACATEPEKRVTGHVVLSNTVPSLTCCTDSPPQSDGGFTLTIGEVSDRMQIGRPDGKPIALDVPVELRHVTEPKGKMYVRQGTVHVGGFYSEHRTRQWWVEHMGENCKHYELINRAKRKPAKRPSQTEIDLGCHGFTTAVDGVQCPGLGRGL